MIKNALLAWCCLGMASEALEVHEWGTFTVLSGPEGRAISWYHAFAGNAGLPQFVHPGITGKSGAAPIRMETPVIYFYPDAPMDVAVEALFESGTITETFPYSTGPTRGLAPGTMLLMKAGKWTGKLHPPTDAAALARIPEIAVPNPLEPYEAARAVPDAWIFESDVREIPGLPSQPSFPEMEKFIFYRGIGFGTLPFTATPGDDDVNLSGESVDRVPFAVSLRVRGDQAAWVKVARAEPGTSTVRTTMPDAMRPLDTVETELVAVWQTALVDAGMTADEAAAMVATWRHTWFREEGDRVLTLVPREVVDAMLPLKITPQPEKLERAFVARLEMITPTRVKALSELIRADGPPTEETFRQFSDLRFGRFMHGAAEIALGAHAPFELRHKAHELMNGKVIPVSVD